MIDDNVPVPFVMPANVSQVVNMRMLVISETGNSDIEPPLGTIRVALQAMGVPFDEFIVSANRSAANANVTFAGTNIAILEFS